MNLVEHVSLFPVGISSGYMLRRGIAGSSGSTMSKFLRNRQADFKRQSLELRWTILRLPNLGIHPLISYQTQTLLHNARKILPNDPVIAVLYEAMPVPGKYRSGCSQSSVGWNTGHLMEELEKVPKELKGSATL
jgi:hypothetical protein